MSQLTLSELDEPNGELVQNESRELIVVTNVRKVSHDQ